MTVVPFPNWLLNDWTRGQLLLVDSAFSNNVVAYLDVEQRAQQRIIDAVTVPGTRNPSPRGSVCVPLCVCVRVCVCVWGDTPRGVAWWWQLQRQSKNFAVTRRFTRFSQHYHHFLQQPPPLPPQNHYYLPGWFTRQVPDCTGVASVWWTSLHSSVQASTRRCELPLERQAVTLPATPSHHWKFLSPSAKQDCIPAITSFCNYGSM